MRFRGGAWSLAARALLFALITWFSLANAGNIAFDNRVLDQGRVIRQLGGVHRVIQDRMGFVWFGADNGLARYDGTRIRLYQSEPGNPRSLPNNYIWDMEVASDGALWIAASDGLCIYRPETDDFERVVELGGKRLLGKFATTLAVTRDGRMLIGFDSGLNIFDPVSKTLQAFTPASPLNAPSNNIIYDLAEDAAGNIAVARAEDGIVRLNPVTGDTAYFNHPSSLSHNHAHALVIDRQDRVWAGTYGGGINVLQPGSDKFTPLTYRIPLGESHNAVVMDLLLDTEGAVWAAVDQQGLLKFSADLQLEEHFFTTGGHPGSLFSDQTRGLMQDINGDLWIGLFPFGVSFMDRSREHLRVYQHLAEDPNSLSHNAVLSLLAKSDGTVWVGTERGLNRLDPATGKITRFLSDPSNPQTLAANAVLAVEEDVRGDVWVGTWSGGLQKFEQGGLKLRRFPVDPTRPNTLGDAFPWTILSDREGTLWAGTETAGLHRYQPESKDFVRYVHDRNDSASISNNYITEIIDDRRGFLWIATYNGLCRFDKQSGTFATYKPEAGNPYSLGSLSVKSLFEDSRGFIWVGLHDAGLNRLDPATGEFVQLGEKEGLPSLVVSSIVEDAEGYIWVATLNGLARVDPNTFAMEVYNEEHGLAGGTYNRDAALAMPDGTLYFGSTEGLTAFKPEHLRQRRSIHPTWITQFRLSNREVPIGVPGSPLVRSVLTSDTLVLQHHHSMFSFDFVTLNYRNAHLNQYAYMLEGFDTGWNYLEQRNTATYTNLDPGRYLFRVQAKAPGEDWQLSEHTIALEIQPPLWRTWWAYTIYCVLVLAFIYAVYVVGRLKKSADRYREKSVTDPLTGTYNRAGIMQIADGLFSNEQMKRGLCVMLLDIDHFKRINDRRGHDAGDRVITGVCALVKEVVRRGDYFGRWGGEEFILICSGTDALGVQILGEKIRRAVAEHVFERELEPLMVSVSIGVAVVAPEEDFQHACKRSDEALYQAKDAGRNCVVLAGDTLEAITPGGPTSGLRGAE